MKCYLVSVENCGWDEYDGVVVAAESEEAVRDMFIYREGYVKIGEDGPMFLNSQGEISIKEVTKKGIVLASFNAG